MGFPEDVKALRHGILDEDEYLHQSGITVDEARRMYERSLHTLRRGLLFSYFSFTDRTQHMFYRAMDPRHPAYSPELARKYGPEIENCYRQADELVGQAREAADANTTLIVLSDHGFAPFYRAFSLNTWLAQNGYLEGKGPWNGASDLLSNADWPNVAAYGIGFNALYLNLRGREGAGSVDPGERDSLLRRLSEELLQARDPQTGARVISRVSPVGRFHPERAPDLIIGYARGYRCSDESVLGGVPMRLLQDNNDKWSGDHCGDRALVPGVLFSNKPIAAEAPSLLNVAASVLSEFGLTAPREMEGRTIWQGGGDVRAKD
jgi:predicted AlkP superfamily phosphohydrolase/phosphomutase